uniref:non-specific serine/threonine protein kinase n=1 Tax=Biomphalaria glabrata TaxID=6526 RepID=A0A2C9M689_BIOGL
MGNQLTGEAPAIIYPVEHYLTDIPHYEFDCSLGSTRFFKVVRARCKEGLVVVRIFVIQGSSVPLPLKEYQDRLDVIYKSLKNLPNCLPFQKHVKLDRAAFLIRQYIKYSLYDRLSTRPFLTLIEKRWIAFQLLCALNQCHKVQVRQFFCVCFLSNQDNPADFSYFFDTSRRRVCYIAPERFIGRPPSEKNSDGSLDESQNKVYKELSPAMDIFSAGCVIIELFCDGTPPFDLSQLLNYSCKNYSPWKLIDTIPDNNIKFQFSNFRLLALKLMLRLSKYVTSDIILDRILPHMLYFTQDPLPEVRAETIRTVTACIRNLKSVPRNDANVFQDYIIPALSPLLSDEVLQVRLTFAENIAELADTAVKYLDMAQAQEIREVIVQLKDQQRDKASISETVINVKKTAEELKPEIQEVESNYDMELHQLKDLIHQKIFQLLSDPNHAVKMTLMANGMDKLCLFFGRQKANDILLSHIVTFLNVKDDWRLRACFFKTVVDVTMYVGWQCSEVLLPLLQQGLYDVEEFVITEDLLALKKLTNHRLLNKIMMQTLVCDAAALLAHPGPWIRQAAVGFITAVAQAYDIPDIHCKLMPQLKPFLSRNVMQLRKPAVVLDALSDPIPREVFDYLLRSPLLESVYEVLAKLQKYARSISRQARNPELDESLSQVFRKLTSLGLTEEFEKKLLAMKEFMLRLHKNKTGSSESIHKTSIHSTPGNINIAVFGRGITRRHADLHKNRDSGDIQAAAAAAGKNRKPKKQDSVIMAVITRYAKCKWELRDLVHHRRAQFEADILLTDAISGIAWDTHHPPDTWKPKGVLVAHLQEHRGAINRLSVSHDHKYFASCSNDGTVRIWESGKLEGKTAANRSKVCLNKQGGKIKCVTFLERGNSVASASDNNSIHVYRLDGGSVQLEDSRTLDVRTYGQIMDMTHFDTGAQSILTYATVSSHIIGWDLRSSNPAWTLHNDPRHGLITSFAVNQSQCWLAAGTSSGALVCWDMRFRMPINKMQHASGRKVRRLTMHPSEQSLLVASFNWNNEVSMWDAETGQRQRTLWPSSSPALSYTKLNKTREDDGICSIYVGSTDTKTFVLTGGTDMRLRFWDLSYPANSMCFNYGLDDPRTLSLNYRSQLIEGSEVIQELETQREPLDKYETEREMHLMHSAPLLGHHDIVNDLTLCHSTQTLVISAARNGHIKVWK